MLTTLRNTLSPYLDKAGNWLLSPPYGGIGQFVNHGSRDQKRVALTFDDGPSKGATELLLEVLAELNVHATFFCVGVNAQLNPELLQRMDAAGHIIGNHSWKHRRIGSLRPGHEGSHIDLSAAQIKQVLGREPRLYRPPWGWLTPWEGQRLHQRGYTIVGWDVYTLDWKIPEPDGLQIAAQARQDTRPGSILLFHDAYVAQEVWHKTETAKAVRQLILDLHSDGYTFCTVPELLSVPAYG